MDGLTQVESRTTYTDFKKFTWFSMLKKGKRLKPIFIFMIVAFIVAILSIAMLIISKGFDSVIESMSMYLIMLVIVPPGLYLLMTFTMKMMFEKSKSLFDSNQRYEFLPDGFKVETVGKDLESTAEFKYDAVQQAFEVKDSYYLFIGQQQAYMISKTNIDAVTQKELRMLLESKLGKKFIQCL